MDGHLNRRIDFGAQVHTTALRPGQWIHYNV